MVGRLRVVGVRLSELAVITSVIIICLTVSVMFTSTTGHAQHKCKLQAGEEAIKLLCDGRLLGHAPLAVAGPSALSNDGAWDGAAGLSDSGKSVCPNLLNTKTLLTGMQYLVLQA